MPQTHHPRYSAVTALTLLALIATPSLVASQNVRGFVFGQESGAPMSNVFIRLLSRTLQPLDTARTDMLGRFSFRAAGPERYVIVAELNGYGATPQVVEVSPIAMAKVSVTIGMVSMGTADVEETLGDERIAHIRGRVFVAGSNDGVEGAEVTDLSTGRMVLTRHDGRFVLGDVRPGPVRVRVGHLAYMPREWAVDTQPGSAYDASIPVEESAISVEGIEVTVRSRAVARKLEPVFERMERGLGGMYLTATDFKRRGNVSIAQMVQGLPSVAVTGSGYRWSIRFRRGSSELEPGCSPEVWLDGVRVVRAGSPADDFLAMNTLDVEILELFPSAGSIPSEYATSAFCAIGIWTTRGG